MTQLEITLEPTYWQLTLEPQNGPAITLTMPNTPSVTLHPVGLQGPRGERGENGAIWTTTDW